MEVNKFVIVLGTTYSGSGAVYDYLSGHQDCHDPLRGSEYLLPQLPYGLMSLRAATGQAFHHATADHAFRKFLMIAEILARPNGRFLFGKNFEILLPGFMGEIRRFIDEITISRFPFRIAWWNIDKGLIEKLIDLCLERFLRIERSVQSSYLPVEESVFTEHAQKMHERLFSIPSTSEHQFILLNQAGSGLNPISSTVFFRRRKVILVTRDPRDQFAEMKRYKKAYNVGEFVKWYQAIADRISVNHPDLYVVSFEDFVLNHAVRATAICDFAGISDGFSSAYSAELSKKNISKFRSVISVKESVEIEKHLAKYCI